MKFRQIYPTKEQESTYSLGSFYSKISLFLQILFLPKNYLIKMTRVFLTLVLIITIYIPSYAIYDVNDNCKNAWMLLMDLKIEEAKDLIASEIKNNPENHYAYYIDQTCDAYKLLINSNEADYDAFLSNYDKKRAIMDDMDTESPYYLSCYSEMELQVCIFNVIHGSMYSGIRKGFASYKNTYKNLENHPDFKPSQKMDGFFNVALSNMPPFVKWAVSLMGVSTDIDYGFNMLKENYIQQKDIKGINAEAALFMILAAKINKSPEEVYKFTNALDSNISQTFIHSYFRANIAYRIGKNEEALSTIEQMNYDKNSLADVVYSYMIGKILLRKLDIDAGYYISRYLSNLEKKEYLKEMNYNLALHYLINNDTTKYLYYSKIVREEGKDLNERDREALYDANLDYFPDVNLVKSRLLLDGEYYTRFNSSIQAYEESKSDILGHQLEYLFLMARFNASNNEVEKAISQFKQVISRGDNTDYYFACEACLRLAIIYNEMDQYELAKEYYSRSLKLYKKEYYEYIEDKASKGLNSIKYQEI